MTTAAEILLCSEMQVDLVKYVGGDADLAAAARVSTMGEGSLNELAAQAEATQGLIGFLMRNRHGSPFEHASMTFLVTAPIFVLREFQRHRIGWSYNEESGRYRTLQPEFYVPGPDRPLVQVGRPGQYVFSHGSPEQYERTFQGIGRACTAAYRTYEQLLADGVAREVARCVLPVNTFSSMYATCNPRSLMAFLSLRTRREGSAFPSYPQHEIASVADQMEDVLARLFPITHTAFVRGGYVTP